MIGMMIALAAQTVAAGTPSPQWIVEPGKKICKMTIYAPDGSGQFSILTDREGGVGLFATSRTWPHRTGDLPMKYAFDNGTPVETEALWQGDFEVDKQGHVHGFLADGDGKLLDHFANSKQFGFVTFMAKGLTFEVDVQAGLETGPAAKAAVAKLRACAKTLPKADS